MLEIIVDLKTLREENPDITVGEMIENHIVPKLPDARYFVVNTNPCIILPWVDGTYSENWNPVIRFNVSATTKASSAMKVGVFVGVINMSTNAYSTNRLAYKIVYPDSTFSSGISTEILFNSRYFIWREHTHADIRCIGLHTFSNSTIDLLSMDFNITKCKSIKTNEDIDVAMIVSPDTKGIMMWYLYDGQLQDGVQIGVFSLPIRNNIINVYQFNDGLIYRNDLYLCFPKNHTIIQPMCKFDKSNDIVVNPDSWYLNAFTVNGKTFDIKLTSGSVNTYVTLAKLRQ